MAVKKEVLAQIDRLISENLGSEMQELIHALIADPNTKDSYIIDNPDAALVDLSFEDVQSRVARSSNMYNRMTRFCAIVEILNKQAEAAFKFKYKTNMIGKSAAERELNAMNAAAEEFAIFSSIDSLASSLKYIENGARVSSETARKLLDSMKNMQIASVREENGQYRMEDFD